MSPENEKLRLFLNNFDEDDTDLLNRLLNKRFVFTDDSVVILGGAGEGAIPRVKGSSDIRLLLAKLWSNTVLNKNKTLH